jgi:hypothetical protein
MRVFIRRIVKLQSRPGPAAVLETRAPVEWVTGPSAFSDPRHVASDRRGGKL